MASPLPKIRAPALRKNRSRATWVPGGADAAWATGRTPSSDDAVARPSFGGASHTMINRPAAIKRRAISAPVTAVTTRVIAEMAHRRRSRPFVRGASLIAAMAMMAITPGAIP
jgi:hypothetical protein